ncbi:lytic murein transglycosylase B [Polaromonas glacialis]|uniref:lytic murein transglycosylase B n=1 Tax=Polaromonas glacialis TaxID=866564 RepID=UPI000ABF3784
MTLQPPFFRFKPAVVLTACLILAACAGGKKPLPPKVETETAQPQPQPQPPAPIEQAQPQLPPQPSLQPQPQPPGGSYATRPDVMAFADELASRRKLDPQWVRLAMGQSSFNPTVSRLMQPPTKTFVKNWRVYRSRFIDPVRIAAGVRFWKANAATLARAEKEYGVPADIIVGIIGVETIYGRDTGSFRVMDALMTLAFDFPSNHPRAQERSTYFRGEVEQFLALQNQRQANPMDVKGSYAGAMGMPQFMPSSQANYAVDFDGDGNIDLWNSPADVIGSVANYFKAYGWQSGMPTHYPVRFDASRLDMDALMAPDILPTFGVDSFMSKGAVLEGPALEHKGPLALVELLNGPDAPSYFAGTENFYVITRYNWSSYYALSVIELGREVAQAMRKDARR